jgi:hypothetical protein
MIPKKALEIIDYVISYVGDSSNDWFRIKMEIISRSEPAERGLFSRRSQSNRKQIINSYEGEVITYWESKTGVAIWIDPEKLQADDWVRKYRGDSLKEINETRKKQKRERLEREAKKNN